jgi:protein-L-isoaspartate(D-aspartate) O-methyltransferase
MTAPLRGGALVEAFARVPREDYLGPGPWRISSGDIGTESGDGTAFDPGMCDAMLINAGVTLPLPRWLDRLQEGGRIIVPLTFAVAPTLGKGTLVKITRESGGFAARSFGMAIIYSCASARDPLIEPSLIKALTTGALLKLTCARRDHHEPHDTCIVHGPQVCLSSEFVR